MTALWLRCRAWVRAHGRRAAIAAVLIGVVCGVTIGLAAGTRRTSTAPDRYTAFAGGDPDLQINQWAGAPLTARVRELDGVAKAASIVFVPAFLLAPDGSPIDEPNPFFGDPEAFGARVLEGRFADPTAPGEFTVNRAFFETLAERYGVEVGDRFDAMAMSQAQVDANDFGGEPEVAPFPVELVGVFDSPLEFDDPSPMVIFSEALLDGHPDIGVVQTLMAVWLEPSGDADAVVAAVRAMPGGTDAFQGETSIVTKEARRAVGFQVTALWIVVAIAVAGAIAIIAFVVRRVLSTSTAEARSLSGIGWRPRDLVVERAVEGVALAVVAVPVAALVGWVVTAPFPLGALATFEPYSGPRFDGQITLVGTLAIVGVLAATGASAGRGRRRRPRAAEPDAGNRLAVSAGARMPLVTGAQLTTGAGANGRRPLGALVAAGAGANGRRPLGALVAAGAGTTVGVAALIVGLSVTTLTSSPARWGVNYDEMFGNPYVAADDDIVSPVLAVDGIEALSATHFGSLTLGGVDTAVEAVDAVMGGLQPTMLEGTAPQRDDEIALGAETARRLGVDVGDSVEATGPERSSALRVVGIVVTPASAGAGASMTFDGYAALSPSATRHTLMVRFADDAPADVSEAIAAANFSPPTLLAAPTSVRALERVIPAPYALAALIAVLLVLGGVYGIASTVRGARRDLFVLRALGAEGRQLRAAVHWHATLAAALVVTIGTPLGVVLGRRVVSALTTNVGLVPGVETPWWHLALVWAATMVIANVAAMAPAAGATRAVRPDQLLER